jgi:multiple sugar transport system ATP-binding protein
MSSVRLVEVSKRFGPVVALDDLNLEVADGEFLVLVGPSGCGKTMARRIAVLHEGRLQQLDSPQGLYDRPRNLFVAGFIGSPAINTLPARYHDGSFVGDGFRVSMEGRPKAPAVRPAQDLVLGVRPEDMRILDGAPPPAVASLGEGAVDLVETLGSDTFLTLSGPWGSVVVRVEPRAEYAPGRRLPVGLLLDRLHVFDAATGEAIT